MLIAKFQLFLLVMIMTKMEILYLVLLLAIKIQSNQELLILLKL